VGWRAKIAALDNISSVTQRAVAIMNRRQHQRSWRKSVVAFMTLKKGSARQWRHRKTASADGESYHRLRCCTRALRASAAAFRLRAYNAVLRLPPFAAACVAHPLRCLSLPLGALAASLAPRRVRACGHAHRAHTHRARRFCAWTKIGRKRLSVFGCVAAASCARGNGVAAWRA